MHFEEFKKTVKEGIRKGEIVLLPKTELTELDLAVQYAIGAEIEARGIQKNFYVTAEEIYYLIIKHCGVDVCKRVLLEGGESNG